MTSQLSILSAGAVQSLVTQLREPSADRGVQVDAAFGAVGAMKERLLAGEPCDLFITSALVMDELRSSGQLIARAVGDVGWVQTSMAVRVGEPVPDVSTTSALERALRAASALFFPDPVRATAGIHFANVLEQIGVTEQQGVSLSIHPNGATAMRALAGSDHPHALGCTQATEILQTEGLTLAGPLPPPYDLVTQYQCALIGGADARDDAVQMYELLTGPQTKPLRETLGLSDSEWP